MFHGLMKDSAVIGTYKHIKHASKPKRRKSKVNQGFFADLEDLFSGLAEIAGIIAKMKGKK